MTTYIALVNYTDAGMRHIKDSPKRLDQAKDLLRSMGGELKSFYLTMGEHDIVFTFEAPDDAVAARFAMMLGMAGHVRTKTLKAFPEAAYREIISTLG